MILVLKPKLFATTKKGNTDRVAPSRVIRNDRKGKRLVTAQGIIGIMRMVRLNRLVA